MSADQPRPSVTSRPPVAIMALVDLFRPRCWTHTGIVAWSADEGNEYAEPSGRKPWISRFRWPRNLYPWFGGDEWCRWTLVMPLIVTSLVVPLWACRNPACEACVQDCQPAHNNTRRQS